MINQWKGGCVNCGKFRWTPEELAEGVDLASRNVHIIRKDGNKTIVGMCKECFDLDDYDLDNIKQNWYNSELECLDSRVKGKEEHAARLPLVEGIKDLEFVGFVKP